MPKGDDDELTPLQLLFVQEYIVDYNGTRAHKDAGYKGKNDNVHGVKAWGLLRKGKVQRAIGRQLEVRQEATGLTAENIINKLMAVHDRCMTAKPVQEKIDGVWTDTGEWKFDSTGALKALDQLAKMLGYYTIHEKKEITIKGNVTATIDNPGLQALDAWVTEAIERGREVSTPGISKDGPLLSDPVHNGENRH